ncbi:MAG: hypothetical protein ABUL44_01880, partial [Flavobacterium sp.]
MDLTENQKIRILTNVESGYFNLDSEIEVLVKEGFSKEEAAISINELTETYQQIQFNRKVKEAKREDHRNVAFVILFLLGLVGPVLNIDSMAWYATSCIIAAATGYWAYKEMPLAGVIGSVILVILFPITYRWY